MSGFLKSSVQSKWHLARKSATDKDLQIPPHQYYAARSVNRQPGFRPDTSVSRMFSLKSSEALNFIVLMI